MKKLETLETIKTRRVHYHFQTKGLPDAMLWEILEAARWAPTANNQRVHRYVCLTDPSVIQKIKLLSPGFVANPPPALIVICIDWHLARYESYETSYHNYIDVGTAAQNMLLAAHAMGLAGGIVTSLGPEALKILLNLPEEWSPEMLILLGYPAAPPPGSPSWPKSKVRAADLVQWGAFPDTGE